MWPCLLYWLALKHHEESINSESSVLVASTSVKIAVHRMPQGILGILVLALPESLKSFFLSTVHK